MMIKNFIPQPYIGENPLPTYVSKLRQYILVGTIAGGYKITLAKLTIGDSISASNLLTHALFESYNDHGEQMALSRTRVSGHEREFWAVKNAMINVGIEFKNVTSCSSEEIMKSLGAWFRKQNSDIKYCSVVSHTSH